MHLKNNSSKFVNFCVAILLLQIEENKRHFWHIMLYYFKEGKNSTETQKICTVSAEGTVTDHMCQKWFVKFRARDFLWISPQSGRLVEIDSSQIEIFIENNQHYTMQGIANIFKIPKSIKSLVKIKKCVLFYGKKHTNLLANPGKWGHVGIYSLGNG